MHRLAAVPGLAGDGPDKQAGEPNGAAIAYVEQPPAPVLLLSSADTDLVALAALLQQSPELLGCEARALNLAALAHPAVIDHYIATTLPQAKLVLVRLLGGRGHWSYGLEQLMTWAAEPAAGGGRRQLLVLAGTADQDQEFADLGTVPAALASALAGCLREGGPANLRQLLRCLAALLAGELPVPPKPLTAGDPLPHDWRADPGPRLAVILYRAQLQAGDAELMEAVLAEIRRQGLCPRGLWVSSLRDPAVQRGVGDLLARERVEAVLCGTGFASVQFEEAGLGAPLWDRLGVPVLQLLCSGQPRRSWQESSIGLGPLDLSLQVALPELDGRIGSRVGAFKELVEASGSLATALQRLRPDPERLAWIVELCRRWIQLRRTAAPQRRVGLVLANYPNRNSRLANGVGLDTPASATAMLRWLRQEGYDLGDAALPTDGDQLIQMLLAGRSNDPESSHRAPLDQLPLATYLAWYERLPQEGRRILEQRWGAPPQDAGLEPGPTGPGFAVRGLRFGQLVLLIQPERGYDRDPSLSYHSPDLPPTHAYLAQYLWLREGFAADVVVHVGKHGNLEWLPGKGVGLSAACFPEWALGPLPHLYPFIVNDPGEGSQAKRRAQAVILDHLTPPLGRAGLHGELLQLEALLDEYWEARSLGGERAGSLRQRLAAELERLQLPAAAPGRGGEPEVERQPMAAEAGATAQADLVDLDQRLDAADGYLCEIKEAQIRLGLHRYGQLPDRDSLAELLLCLARAPQEGLPGLTQALARDLGLGFDPWADPEQQPLAAADRLRLQALPWPWPLAAPGAMAPAGPDGAGSAAAGHPAADPREPAPLAPPPAVALRCVGDGCERLEAWALTLVRAELDQAGTGRATPTFAGPTSGAERAAQSPWGHDSPAAGAAGSEADRPDTGPAAPTIPGQPRLAAGGTEGSAAIAAANGPAGAGPTAGDATEQVLVHLRRRLLPALLACGESERRAFLAGVAGERIAAGPSGAPTRGRPDLLPTGRNFYSVDLRGLPTEAAWDLGRRSAELLLELHLQEQGEDLRTLALSVWGTATMRNGGEDIAQALALMGVRPVWDGPSRRMVDLEVIPLRLLGRPRVDVSLRISGLFRDAFPQLVGWMNRAARLVAALTEEGEANPLAVAAAADGHWGRVWGSAPGAYGAGLQGLIDSGHWEDRGDLAQAYLNWSQWRYDGEMGSGAASQTLRSELDREGLERRLREVQVVLHNQDNREHDLLDSDDYYQFQGGLSSAVEHLRGSAPALWFGDHSRQQRPRLHRLEREFDKVLRSRLLNPRWIEAMQRHGYKGGFEMAASLDYLFAYDASTGRVPDWSYGALSQSWLGSEAVLRFLRCSNPWALRDMAERLLEAQQRGLWRDPPAQEISRLRSLVLESEALIETM
jgi:cobaltochelatase CobN